MSINSFTVEVREEEGKRTELFPLIIMKDIDVMFI